MKRMGMVIGLKPDQLDTYKRLHQNFWPEILDGIRRSQIRNYSIFLKQPENLLFGYWEYHGDDFPADAAKMADDPITRKWWELTDPCQVPLEHRKDGEWWAMMEEVFHFDG